MSSNWNSKYLIWHLVVMNTVAIGITFADASLTLLISLYATDILHKSKTFAGTLTSVQAIGNTLYNPIAGMIISHTSCEFAMISNYFHVYLYYL